MFVGDYEEIHQANHRGFVKALSDAGLEYREEDVVWRVAPDQYGQVDITEDVKVLAAKCSAFLIDGQMLLDQVARALDSIEMGSERRVDVAVTGIPPFPYIGRRTVTYALLHTLDVAKLGATLMQQMISSTDVPNDLVSRVHYSNLPVVVENY
jgi:hypothetical protein